MFTFFVLMKMLPERVVRPICYSKIWAMVNLKKWRQRQAWRAKAIRMAPTGSISITMAGWIYTSSMSITSPISSIRTMGTKRSVMSPFRQASKNMMAARCGQTSITMAGSIFSSLNQDEARSTKISVTAGSAMSPPKQGSFFLPTRHRMPIGSISITMVIWIYTFSQT